MGEEGEVFITVNRDGAGQGDAEGTAVGPDQIL